MDCRITLPLLSCMIATDFVMIEHPVGFPCLLTLVNFNDIPEIKGCRETKNK